jgi:hypothetical protein
MVGSVRSGGYRECGLVPSAAALGSQRFETMRRDALFRVGRTAVP